MLINVIGLGYIGLPTALMLAAHGNKVMGTDYNEELVATLSAGMVTFEEDGLEELFADARAGGVVFSTEYQSADMYIVSVPTPYDKTSKKIDPGYVVAAVGSVLEVCSEDAIVVIESTISPGTIDNYVRPRIQACGKNIRLAHAPERIIPGNMIHELVNNARTIGADDPAVAKAVRDVYATFCKAPINLADIRTAEMSKVVENTFRDINIAYANELSRICNEAGLDVYEVIRVANTHPRVNILQPGPGVGGHCLSVDPWFLVGDYRDTARLIRTAREVNDSQPQFVLSRVRALMAQRGIEEPSRVGFYGATYKANVEDTRESPMLQAYAMMTPAERKGFRVYDPYVKREFFANQVYDLDNFLDSLELVVVMVGHNEIIESQDRLSDIAVFDTCHVLPVGDIGHL